MSLCIFRRSLVCEVMQEFYHHIINSISFRMAGTEVFCCTGERVLPWFAEEVQQRMGFNLKSPNAANAEAFEVDQDPHDTLNHDPEQDPPTYLGGHRMELAAGFEL